jgi:hypothetical protein
MSEDLRVLRNERIDSEDAYMLYLKIPWWLRAASFLCLHPSFYIYSDNNYISVAVHMALSVA